METQRTFELYTGVLYAELKDGIATPQYNAYRIETTGKDKEKKKEVTKQDKIDAVKGAVKAMELTSGIIIPKTRKLYAKWSPEIDQELAVFADVDTEQELIEALERAKKKKE